MEEAPNLPAAAIADAAVRLRRDLRAAPAAVRRLARGAPVAGPAVPCRHSGSVDVFLEALETTEPGSILVIDNGGRDDEGCVGDLTVAEVQAAGLAGMVVWGLHRDEAQLRDLALPLWSLGTIPLGPREARAAPADRLTRAAVGAIDVTPDDIVVADDDGVLFVRAADWPEIAAVAADIVATERRQAERIAAGESLREQLKFADYLAARRIDAGLDFRAHLRRVGGAIEE